MRRNSMGFAVLAMVLGLQAGVFGAEDPRPTVLVVGDAAVLPFGNGASWVQLVQKGHPDWKVVVNGDGKRTVVDLAGQMEGILKEQGRAEAVVLLAGTYDAAADVYAKNDAGKVAAAMKEVVGKIRANAGTSKAKILLCTPLPVVDARVDQWSKEKFKGGEANCDAIAEALRGVAKETGAELVDFHKWVKDDAEGGKAGRLVGSIGYVMREWGHPVAARYFDEQLVKANLQPADAAAFAAWKAEYAAGLELQKILAETSEGVVSFDAGAVMGSTKGEKSSVYEIEVPAGVLTGKQLDVVFMSGEKEMAAIGNGGNRPFAQTTLVVKTDGGEVKIGLKGADWQLIDEAEPTKVVDSNLYRFNQQKMNYFGLTNKEAGKRRWCLARFDLSGLAGKKVESAKVQVGAVGGMERFENGKAEGLDTSKIGGPAMAVVQGQDALWDDVAATWKSRDGKIGWSGGKVDAAKRMDALEAFLKTNPPAKVAEMAKEELGKWRR